MRKGLIGEMKVVYERGFQAHSQSHDHEEVREADLTEDDVLITSGCNMAFAAAVLAVATAGDEVILPVPWLAFIDLFRKLQS